LVGIVMLGGGYWACYKVGETLGVANKKDKKFLGVFYTLVPAYVAFALFTGVSAIFFQITISGFEYSLSDFSYFVQSLIPTFVFQYAVGIVAAYHGESKGKRKELSH